MGGIGDFISDTWKDLTQPGWRQADEANRLNETAISQQAGAEAFKQQQAKDMERLALAFLFGKGANQNQGQNGAAATTGKMESDPLYQSAVQGALPSAEEWMNNYLGFLKTSPDTTFNLQRGSLERNANLAKDAVSRNMARRGLLPSGLAAGEMGSLDMDRSRGIADLIGQREDRKGQRLGMGTQITQTALDRALNMFTGAKSGLMGLNTQIPQMTQNMATNVAGQTQQPGVIQSLAGNYAKNKVSDWLNPRYGGIGPNDVAIDGDGIAGQGSSGGSFFNKALKMFLMPG